MRIGNKDLKDLTDEALLLNYNKCLSVEEKRLEVSQHIKFNKTNPNNVGRLPDISSVFINQKEALLEEIKNRKLEDRL